MQYARMEVFGSAVRAARRQRNLSLAALGCLVGADPATLSRIERGHQRPGPTLRRRISETLAIDPGPRSAPEIARELRQLAQELRRRGEVQ